MSKPLLGVIAAAAVLVVAAGGVLLLVKGGHAAPASRVPLAPVFASAPAGWVEALPAHAPPAAPDTYRLWEHPPAAAAAPAATAEAGADATGPLPPAPVAGLSAPGASGPLPIIAADGRTPFAAYRRPFTADGRPRVALVIRGLGLNAQATRTAIETLPPDVTLSFMVYADGLQSWIDLARAHGHEVLLEAPMEPADYPDNDPGPYTLMAGGQPQETVQRLEWILSRGSGYFGVLNYLGERFLGGEPSAQVLATALRGRGLALYDDGLGRGRAAGPLRVTADRVIDASLTAATIDGQLAAVEAGARTRGQGLAIGAAYPVTLDAAARWVAGLEARGLRLAPASALAKAP